MFVCLEFGLRIVLSHSFCWCYVTFCWRLIDNPSFIAKHHNRATFNKNKCIIVERFIEQHSKNVLSFVFRNARCCINIYRCTFFQRWLCTFFGPCNDIIYLSVNGDIVLSKRIQSTSSLHRWLFTGFDAKRIGCGIRLWWKMKWLQDSQDH